MEENDAKITEWVREVAHKLSHEPSARLKGHVRLSDHTKIQKVSDKEVQRARQILKRQSGVSYQELEAIDTVIHAWLNKLKEGVYKMVEKVAGKIFS